MIDVALCIGTRHNPWLVALAVFVCCVGALAIVQMFERARMTAGFHRLGWSFLTAVAAGATIWCTHFVAMLAFDAEVPVQLDPVLTIASLGVAVGGSMIGFTVATWRPTRLCLGLGGALFGGAISAMHYIGMAAYRVEGIVTWNPAYVALSLLCAAVFSATALIVLSTEDGRPKRVAVGTALIVAAIASLHFIAMTALHITPLRLDDTPLSSEQAWALALATAMVGLVVIVAGVFAALIDRQTRSDALERLHHMAVNDVLTGLPNRAGFQAELERRLAELPGSGRQIGLAVIDLDRFKEINDLHGHKAGDEVLRRLGQRMRETVGPLDVVARLGGDEFVALTWFADRAELAAFVDQLDGALRGPLATDNFETRLGASIGVATFPNDAADAEALVNNADLAMYRAKSEGAGQPRYYDSALDEAIRERRELASDLRDAIERDELDVHYQLQASISTGEVTGYEALLR